MNPKSKQEEKKKDRDRLLLIWSRLLSPIVVIVIIVARAWFPSSLTDSVTLVLIIVAVLPWLALFLESAQFGSASLKFRQLEERQEQQEYQIRALQFLVRNYVSEDELGHLRKLASDDSVFEFTQSTTTKFFEQELNRLRAMRLIANRQGKYLHDLISQQSANVKDYFVIREKGRKYLDLLDEFEEQLQNTRFKTTIAATSSGGSNENPLM